VDSAPDWLCKRTLGWVAGVCAREAQGLAPVLANKRVQRTPMALGLLRGQWLALNEIANALQEVAVGGLATPPKEDLQ
jgi:hypothetical protein